MRAILLTLTAFITLPNYAESCGRLHANRHPVRHVLQHVPVVRNVVKCDCGANCNCKDCCCDSRRLVPSVVGAVLAPVRAVCSGGCCNK